MHTIDRDDVPVPKGLTRMFQWTGEVHRIKGDDYEIE